jgi:hypothetical protein
LQAYITCGWGVHNVGYVMITYGVCDAVFSMGFGAVIKFCGRIPLFVFGACLNVVVIGVLFRNRFYETVLDEMNVNVVYFPSVNDKLLILVKYGFLGF